jgi:hypothetical protein
MTAVMMACVFTILADSLRRWGKALAERRASPSAAR